jgi:hypothetical protein
MQFDLPPYECVRKLLLDFEKGKRVSLALSMVTIDKIVATAPIR